MLFHNISTAINNKSISFSHYPNGSFSSDYVNRCPAHSTTSISSLYLLCEPHNLLFHLQARFYHYTARNYRPILQKMPKTDKRAKYRRAQTDE